VLSVITPERWRLQQPISAERDPVEGIAHHSQIVMAGIGDDQPLALTVEQLQAKCRL